MVPEPDETPCEMSASTSRVLWNTDIDKALLLPASEPDSVRRCVRASAAVLKARSKGATPNSSSCCWIRSWMTRLPSSGVENGTPPLVVEPTPAGSKKSADASALVSTASM